jgi:hypothetical protein
MQRELQPLRRISQLGALLTRRVTPPARQSGCYGCRKSLALGGSTKCRTTALHACGAEPLGITTAPESCRISGAGCPVGRWSNAHPACSALAQPDKTYGQPNRLVD